MTNPGVTEKERAAIAAAVKAALAKAPPMTPHTAARIARIFDGRRSEPAE